MRLTLMLAVLAALALLCALPSPARENELWGASDETIRQWYRGLMRPDAPQYSCCGEADAYWADSFEVDGENYVAVITDDRDVPNRPYIESGTRFKVPNEKLKWDNGNPTGHGVIFISPAGPVLCYVVPGGV